MSDENREPIRLLKQEEILEWIKQPGAQVFRYEGNTTGFKILAVVGLIAVGIAIYSAVVSGFAEAPDWILFAMFMLFGGWCYLTVMHWGLFALRSYVGITETELLVGRGPKAYIVPTSRLSPETIDMTLMQRGKYTSVLPLHVDHLKTSVHLVGPFAHMKNLPIFTGEVLAYMIGEDTEESLEVEDSE